MLWYVMVCYVILRYVALRYINITSPHPTSTDQVTPSQVREAEAFAVTAELKGQEMSEAFGHNASPWGLNNGGSAGNHEINEI